ncbi:MAG: hypothetical protein AAF975_09215, partial [Spirochaetota bacterium]
MLPAILEQLHYFSDEQIIRYQELFLRHDRGTLIALCSKLLRQKESDVHRTLLSLVATLGLLELESEVQQLLNSQSLSLRRQAYACLWQFVLYKARQLQSRYRYNNLARSVADLQAYFQQQFQQLVGVPLHQVLREAQDHLRQAQAGKMLDHTHNPHYDGTVDIPPRKPGKQPEQWENLSQVFQEICGEKLAPDTEEHTSTLPGWDNVLQLAATQLLFHFIQTEDFPADVMESYLQVAKRWKNENSFTMLLHILSAAEERVQHEVWQALLQKAHEMDILPLWLHYLFFSLNYSNNGLSLGDFGFIPLTTDSAKMSGRHNENENEKIARQWCRSCDISGIAERHQSWLDRAKTSRFYLF